jgi:hypothetical protein
MPRKRDREDPDDRGIALAPAITPEQRQRLFEIGYRSAWPSTEAQAAQILRQWSKRGPEPTEPRANPGAA